MNFRLIAIFNEQELELLLSGLPDINIDDLKANTEYHKYTATSLQIVWYDMTKGVDKLELTIDIKVLESFEEF